MFPENSMQFLKFLHEILFCVEASGCIDDQNVGIAGEGGGNGVVADSGGVGAVVAGDDRGFEALTPELELFDSGGTESVTGSKDWGQSLLAEVMGK